MISKLYSQAAQLFAVLAQPRRLEIVSLLREHELTVSQIYSMLDLPQANISQHLMYLRKHAIIQARREGKQVFYSLIDKSLLPLLDHAFELSVNPSGVSAHNFTDLYQLSPLVHDPVCHMQLSPQLSPHSYFFNQKTYYFCASGCYAQFIQNPSLYAK